MTAPLTARSPLIDVHTHVVPRGLPFGHDERFASIHPAGPTAEVLVDGSLFRVVAEAAWDVDARILAMDAAGVTMQAISPMPELFSYWAEPHLGRSFAEAINEAIAEMVAGAPGRFVGLGTVPLQDVDLAIGMVEQVAAMGLVGIEIGSNVGGVCSGDVRFLPFFQAVADADLCVFVHAFHPPYWSCCGDPPMAAGVNFPPEIGTCMAAMVANGTVEQSPGLRVCASHGGGTLPLHLPRMAAFWDADAARVERCPSPYDSVRSMWFDTLTYDPEVLRSLLGLVGPSRVVIGSDAPFFADPPGITLELLHQDSPLADEVLATIRVDSALALLGLTEIPGSDRR